MGGRAQEERKNQGGRQKESWNVATSEYRDLEVIDHDLLPPIATLLSSFSQGNFETRISSASTKASQFILTFVFLVSATGPQNNLLTVLAFRRHKPCPDTQTNCNNNHTEHFSFTLLDYLTEVLHISNQTNCLLQFNYCQHLSFTLLYFSRAITHFSFVLFDFVV